MSFIIGQKIGMMQIFDETGQVVPVTVLKAGPCPIVQIKNIETDGYNSVKLGFGSWKKEKNMDKAHIGQFVKRSLKPLSCLKEFRTNKLDGFEVGKDLKADVFKAGDWVDVVGVTKGKGFQGVVKRHGFKGGPKTHGQSDRERAPGAIGSNTFPAHVWKGKRMAGHMGVDIVTIQKLKVIQVDAEKNIMLICGALPGNNKAPVYITSTVKKIPIHHAVPVKKQGKDKAKDKTKEKAAPTKDAPKK